MVALSMACSATLLMSSTCPEGTEGHHQRDRGHHRVEVGQPTGIQGGPGFSSALAQWPSTASTQASDGQALHPLFIGFRCPGELFQNRASIDRALPSIQARLAARTVAQWWLSGPPSALISRKIDLGLVTPAQQEQGHGPHRSRLRCTAFGCGSRRIGSAASRIEQDRGAPRRRQIQLRIRRQVGVQGQQRPAHGRAHVPVGLARQPPREPSTDTRQVHLTGGGPAQFAVQRMREGGHQTASGALDRDQVHLLGGLQVGVVRQDRTRTSTLSGSHCESVSSTSAIPGSSSPSRRPTMSVMLWDTATSPSHIHTPADLCIRPAAIWSFTNCSRYSALPPVSFQNRRVLRLSTGPAAADSMRVAAAVADSGSRSIRLEQAVFPQGGHRVGFGAAGTCGDDHDARPASAPVGVRRARERIEKVGVVHADDDPALPLLGNERIDDPPHVRAAGRTCSG